MRTIPASLSLCLVLLGSSLGHAEEPAEPTAEFRPALDIDYLWDGGAAPFVFGSLAVRIAADLWLEPPDEPRFFPATDGPALPISDTVPSTVLGAYGAAGVVLIALGDEPSRWHHVKGYAEAALTTSALTSLTKNFFGRRRPHFPAGEDPDRKRSFFSGHASMSAVTTVYVGLYLHEHIFPKYTGTGATVWKSAAWLALGGVLVGVPYSRLHDNRHYLSDVVAGTAVGSGLALAFFIYQERRFDTDEQRFLHKRASSLSLVPDFQNPGVTLQGRW